MDIDKINWEIDWHIPEKHDQINITCEMAKKTHKWRTVQENKRNNVVHKNQAHVY